MTRITIAAGLAVMALTLMFGGDSQESDVVFEVTQRTRTSVAPIAAEPLAHSTTPAPADDRLDLERSDAVRASLATAIDTYLPGLKLSDNELEALTDATRRLREAQEALRILPEIPEHADARSEARAQLLDAVDDFSYVVGMSPAEFTRHVQPTVGIDQGATPEKSEILLIPLYGEPR